MNDPAHSNQQILAYVFGDGDTNNNSLTTLLFKRIISQMQHDLGNKDILIKNPDFELVRCIHLENAKELNHYLKTLKENSKPYSFEKPSPAVPPSPVLSRVTKSTVAPPPASDADREGSLELSLF
jgi:hypothetical protein